MGVGEGGGLGNLAGPDFPLGILGEVGREAV